MRNQASDGGFALIPGGPSNAQSTAWAVQGLLAAGREPSRVRRNGSRDPMSYLRSLTAANGEVRYSRSSRQTPVWVTAQAVAALARKTLPLKPVRRARRGRVAATTSRRAERHGDRDRHGDTRRRARPARRFRRSPRRRRGAPRSRRRVPVPARAAPRSSRRADALSGRGALGSRRVVYGPARMRIGVPKETADGERRVALVPDVVRRLSGAGHEVVIEAGAGAGAGVPDGDFTEAGASVGDPWGADVIARVAPGRPASSSASTS